MNKELRMALEEAAVAYAYTAGVLTSAESALPETIQDALEKVWRALDGLGVCVTHVERQRCNKTVSDLRSYHEQLSQALWVAEEVLDLAGIND